MEIPGFPTGPKNIVRGDKVQDWLAKHLAGNKMLADAFHSLEWSLSHDPYDGMCIEGGKMAYVQLSGNVKHVPTLWVTYTIHDNHVYLVSIKAV